MPFHTEDEFRGANRKGNRSKDTLRKQFWRENPVIGPNVLLKGELTSAEYTIRRKNMKIPDYSFGRNRFVRGIYHWGKDTRNVHNRYMIKFYSSRDHHRVKTGNSRKKWLLKGWFIEGKECNFHKVRNNRVYRTYTSKKEATLDNDFSVNDKKPLTLPVDSRYHTLRQTIPQFDGILFWNPEEGGWLMGDDDIRILPKYKTCSLCDLVTSNTHNCDECGGEYSICSSHKRFHNLCHLCGLKCRTCKAISSMRFDNPSRLNNLSFYGFGGNKRKIVGKFITIDICDSCEDGIVDRIQDADMIKDIGKMIVEYVRE